MTRYTTVKKERTSKMYRTIESEIIEIVAERLKIRREIVYLRARLSELGGDELHLIEFQMDIEERYNIEFPEEEWDHYETVERMAHYVARNLQEMPILKKQETILELPKPSQKAG